MVTLRSGGTYAPSPDSSSDIQDTAEMPETHNNTDSDTHSPVTNEQIHKGIQDLTALVTKNNDNMESITNDIQIIKGDITKIKVVTNEAVGIKEQLYSTMGKMARLELKNQQLEDKLLAQESKMYEKDLMFYNLADSGDETNQDLKNTLFTVMRDAMKIPLTDLFHRNNTAGEIRIDTVNRIGKFRTGKTRPVTVTFTTKSGRYLVYSKKYTTSLKESLPTARVAEHYPSIIREKRQTQTKHLIDLRKTNNNVKLVKDKIYVNNTEHNTNAFERNPLKDITPLSINYEKLSHSEEIVEKNSKFQAHCLNIKTIGHATAAKNAIYQNPDLVNATHMMYAYKKGTVEGLIFSGFSDDNEIQGGSKLMELIETKKLTDIFICVTRIKNGPNIGPVRFTHIETCAKELLAKEHPLKEFNKTTLN